MSHRFAALPVLAAVPLLLGLALWPASAAAPATWVTAALVVPLTLGQLAWHLRRLTWLRALLWPVLAWLTLSLLSYLLPEHWIAHAAWNRLAEGLVPGSHVDDWRPPLLVMVSLTLLGLGLHSRTRANLGAPLLLATTGLALAGQALEHRHGHSLLAMAAPWPVIGAQACLLLAQLIDALGGWRVTRGSIRRALWPSLLLVLIVLVFWHHQKVLVEHTLKAGVQAQGQRLADRLTGEIDAHLAAMRRFGASWEWLDAPPSTERWARQASLYHRDFRYFLNIAFIDTNSRIRRVYPPSEVNQALVGTRLFDAQPEGREALGRALDGEGVRRTEIIGLLQGQPGIIHYLPVSRDDDGRILGAVGMVVGLQSLADTLFRQVDPHATALALFEGDRLLAYQGPAQRQGPWQHTADIDISGKSLTLITRPARDALLARRSRLPVISLVVGLTLSYLLYLALFARHRMLLQHRQVRRSNRELRREVRTRADLQKEVEWLAEHDELTRLPNRRRFMQVLDAQANSRPLSVLLCDIDHFKRINDRFGHLVGDRYLAELGRLGHDVVGAAGGTFARFGGEEFIACLPGLDTDAAVAVADRLRRRLAEAGLNHEDGSPMTLSVGVATLGEGPLKPEVLLQEADDALYRAKARGRDRVERATPRADLARAGI
ncbi:diguanylate cyclase [Halomonas organivorans]